MEMVLFGNHVKTFVKQAGLQPRIRVSIGLEWSKCGVCQIHKLTMFVELYALEPGGKGRVKTGICQIQLMPTERNGIVWMP